MSRNTKLPDPDSLLFRSVTKYLSSYFKKIIIIFNLNLNQLIKLLSLSRLEVIEFIVDLL